MYSTVEWTHLSVIGIVMIYHMGNEYIVEYIAMLRIKTNINTTDVDTTWHHGSSIVDCKL